MRVAINIFFTTVFLFFTANASFAQIESQKNDSIQLQLKNTKLKSEDNGKSQNIKETNKGLSRKSEDVTQLPAIKQVKSARPDMSKARSARPHEIVRPNGSRIPKGVGRPVGAVPGRK